MNRLRGPFLPRVHGHGCPAPVILKNWLFLGTHNFWTFYLTVITRNFGTIYYDKYHWLQNPNKSHRTMKTSAGKAQVHFQKLVSTENLDLFFSMKILSLGCCEMFTLLLAEL